MVTSTVSTVVLVSTLGHRDLLVDGQRIPAATFRRESERLSKALRADETATLARLSFPIFEPVVTWVIDRHTTPRGQKPHLKVYLVVTDQADPSYRETDTVHLFPLARAWLLSRFGSPRAPDESAKAASLDVNEWRYRGNPAAFDDTLRYVRSLVVRRSVPALGPEAAFYVHVTSGTPGLIFGLIAGLAPVLDERAVVLFKGEHDPWPTPTSLLTELRRYRILAEAESRLREHAFGAAASLLESLDDATPLAHFARALAHRLDFDFSQARRELDEVVRSTTGPLRDAAQRLRRELDGLRRHAEALERATEAAPDDYPALLRELLFNARLAWDSGRYADFLARAFRLEEAVLRWAVERWLGLPTGSAETPRGQALPGFIEGIERDPELLAQAQKSYDGLLDYRRAPTRDLLRNLLAVSRFSDDERVQRIVQLSGRLSRLSGLRNRSIVGHGFHGVSREAIEGAYGGDVVADLCELAATAGIDPGDDPFAAAREALLADLYREQARG